MLRISLNIFASKMIKELMVLCPSVSFSQEQLWLHRTSQLGGGGDASEKQSDVLLWGGGNQKPRLSLPLPPNAFFHLQAEDQLHWECSRAPSLQPHQFQCGLLIPELRTTAPSSHAVDRAWPARVPSAGSLGTPHSTL